MKIQVMELSVPFVAGQGNDGQVIEQTRHLQDNSDHALSTMVCLTSGRLPHDRCVR